MAGSIEHVVEAIVARSVGVSYPAINALGIGDIRVPQVPLNEQLVVADFLDAETARIDALIAKKRQLVKLLEERIDALVRHQIAASPLVTSSATIPAIPIKRLLTKVGRPASAEDRMVTAFRNGQVTARSIRRAEGYTESWTEGARVQGG